jgi:hypothetical protein
MNREDSDDGGRILLIVFDSVNSFESESTKWAEVMIRRHWPSQDGRAWGSTSSLRNLARIRRLTLVGNVAHAIFTAPPPSAGKLGAMKPSQTSEAMDDRTGQDSESSMFDFGECSGYLDPPIAALYGERVAPLARPIRTNQDSL